MPFLNHDERNGKFNSMFKTNIEQSNFEIAPKRYINNNSLNSSPNMFVLENERLEQRIQPKNHKLNLENVTSGGLETDGIPQWFRSEFNTLQDLGEIQQSYSAYPYGQVPLGIVSQQLAMQNPKATFTTNDKTALMKLINSISTSAGSEVTST